MKTWIIVALFSCSLSSYAVELTQLTEYQLDCPNHPLITVDVDNYGLLTEKWGTDHFEISAQQTQQTVDNNKLLTVYFRNTDQFQLDQAHRYYYHFAGEKTRVSCQLVRYQPIKLKTLLLYQAPSAEKSIRQQ